MEPIRHWQNQKRQTMGGRGHRVQLQSYPDVDMADIAMIGINPATDNVAQIKKLLDMIDSVIQRYNIPTQSCVLTHVTNTLEAMKKVRQPQLA